MTPIVLRYAEDRTGVNPNNKVVAEGHITVNRRVRAIAPYYGPFYSESLVVKNKVTGATLIPNIDYHAVEYYESISNLTGKEVCSVVLIVNEGIKDQEFELEYQTVGGEFSFSTESIAKMMDKINADERPVHWGNIINLPPEFTPSPHLHDVGDTYGWEYVVAHLELVRRAILMGDNASHDELFKYIDDKLGDIQVIINALNNRVSAHIENLNNPHQTTKAQVGLGNVENYLVSTKTQAEIGIVNTAYMTPLRTKEAITYQTAGLENLVSAHVDNKSNPHGVTKAQVGLGSVENYAIATIAEAQAGTVHTAYMTPLRTKEAITYQAVVPLTTHTDNKSNPHGVTKAQVGLGSVSDYPIATLAEAQVGTVNVAYMTPLRTKDAITFQAVTPLNTHIANLNNPHSVTKAQVGLGLVENYRVATSAEATAGTINTVYMTPLRTKEAISTQAGDLLKAHTSNVNNPHSVTKAQVGLGSVENYAIATTAEAQAGTVHTSYMTPLRVKEAVTYQAVTPMNTHINNKSNPHGVTKDQLGLGNVLNYTIATNAEAVAGTINTAYMTPLRTKEAITSQAVTPLNAHTNNKSNPHAVTAAQVGTMTTAQINAALATKLDLTGGTVTGTVNVNTATGVMGMLISGGNATMVAGQTSDTLRIESIAGATGDAGLAGMSFFNSGRYGINMGLRHDGYFGIGGSSSVAWRWYSATNGDTYQTGDSYIYSDPRLKENKQIIQNPLEKLSKIDGCSFTWKNLGPKVPLAGKKDFGIMANEVEAVFPEMVTDGIEMDGVQYKTVAYTKLIPVLIEAIKELNNKVESLQTELKNIKGS